MRAFYRSRKNMATSFRIKATVCRGALRACQGRQVSSVAGARKEILEEKVYRRGDISRPLTRNLINSERIRFRGNVAEISNSAPYVGIRDAATGESELYGHDLELDFAKGAVEKTRVERLADARATVRAVMNAGK